jgi:hypothetical protein
MDADISDRISDRPWFHGFLLKPLRSFLAGNQEFAAGNLSCEAAHGQGRVSRRVTPGSTAAALSDRNDGRQSFSAGFHISAHLRSSAVKKGC